METDKRQVILIAEDKTIDIMIRCLVQNGGFGSIDPAVENIIKQLKAEQKRLFYPD